MERIHNAKLSICWVQILCSLSHSPAVMTTVTSSLPTAAGPSGPAGRFVRIDMKASRLGIMGLQILSFSYCADFINFLFWVQSVERYFVKCLQERTFPVIASGYNLPP